MNAAGRDLPFEVQAFPPRRRRWGWFAAGFVAGFLLNLLLLSVR